jgi:hypothetical protein
MSELADRVEKILSDLATHLAEEFAADLAAELERLFPTPSRKRRGPGRPPGILKQFEIATFMFEGLLAGKTRKQINTEAMARFNVTESLLFKSRGYSRLRPFTTDTCGDARIATR